MNKVLVEIYVPVMETKYDVFLPINKTIEETLILINKAINEISNGMYMIKKESMICNKNTGKVYVFNQTIKDSGIRNGTKLLLI